MSDAATTQGSRQEWFATQVRVALLRLYDARALRASPLVHLLEAPVSSDLALALRQTIIEGIERMQPASSPSTDGHDWRIYQILRRRYVQQLTQERVAFDIGLSVRQLQREEHIARLELAAHLWQTLRLDERLSLVDGLQRGQAGPPVGADEEEGWEQELAWLDRSSTLELCRLDALFDDVLQLARPALLALRVTPPSLLPADDGMVALRAAIVRQVLLNLMIALAHRVPGGRLSLRVELLVTRMVVHLRAASAQMARSPEAADRATDEDAVSLTRLKRLVELMEGHLDWPLQPDMAGDLCAVLVLPLMRPIDVLVVDDNPDALRLFERYLAGTRYHFLGAQTAAEALSLIETRSPPLVVLDLMMPGQDGWSLLARLRQQGAAGADRSPAVVVCSILGQKDLAFNLGADDLLLKPVTRQALLETLDRQWQRIAMPAG